MLVSGWLVKVEFLSVDRNCHLRPSDIVWRCHLDTESADLEGAGGAVRLNR